MFRIPLLPSALLAIATATAQSPVQIALQSFATGFTKPVDIVHAGDDRLFIVQQAGQIRILEPNGTIHTNPFLNITGRVNSSGNEQGLLSMAFDPNYATNGFFYVYYINGSGSGTGRISRFSVTANPDSADANSEQILYTRVEPYTNHNGGDLNFGADGYLYFAFGDGGSGGDPQAHAQNLTDALGDMIRLDVSDPDTTYTIPPTNPYATVTNDTLPEIWASGLRNPWRWGFDALTHDMWIGDVGQGLYEEIDFWPAGDNSGPNFGWRCYEGNTAYNTSGCHPASFYMAPISVHTHAAGWCAITGGRVYRGSQFPRLYGRYLYTDYCPAPFFSIRSNGMGGWIIEQVMAAGGLGIACIAENSANELFAANVETGVIYHMVDVCPMAAPVISQTGDLLTSTLANEYVWYFNGVEIPNATGQSYTATATGVYQVLGTFAGGCELLSDTLFVSLVGLEDIGTSAIRVHPIPAADKLIVDGLPLTAVSLRLVDVTGRGVATRSIAGEQRIVVDVDRLASGNYVVLVNGANGAELLRRNVIIGH